MDTKVTIFHDIYRRYAPDVNRFAYWLCGNADEAKDLTAETFIRLWTAKGDLRMETVKAYLFTITRNIFLQRRRDRAMVVALDESLIDPAPLPDARLENRSQLQILWAGLQSLPEIDRTALILKVYEDLPYAEIARLLGLTVAAVKVKIHRARIKLAALAKNVGGKHHEDH